MTSDPAPVFLSAIDEECFGLKVARAPDVSLDALPSIMDFCAAQSVELLIARCPADRLQVAQAMERVGFILMGTLVCCECDLVGVPVIPDNGETTIRLMRTGEEVGVKDVAAAAFHGFSGHYHSDSRLNRDKCDEAYISWAHRSCVSRDVAEAVLLAELDGTVVGFLTLRLPNPEEGEGPLIAVSPAAQGRGISRSLMIAGMEWCRSRGCKTMSMSTQLANIPARRLFAGLGFEPVQSYYTFHRWFDSP